jgi:hypothetical protein
MPIEHQSYRILRPIHCYLNNNISIFATEAYKVIFNGRKITFNAMIVSEFL